MAGTGQRVAAFNMSKYCKLISISHGILGLNNVTGKGVNIKAFQVALLDPQGNLKSVEVPFHLSLRYFCFSLTVNQKFFASVKFCEQRSLSLIFGVLY